MTGEGQEQMGTSKTKLGVNRLVYIPIYLVYQLIHYLMHYIWTYCIELAYIRIKKETVQYSIVV